MKREFYERVVASTVMYRVKTWVLRKEKGHKVYIMEMKCFGVFVEGQ